MSETHRVIHKILLEHHPEPYGSVGKVNRKFEVDLGPFFLYIIHFPYRLPVPIRSRSLRAIAHIHGDRDFQRLKDNPQTQQVNPMDYRDSLFY